MRGDFIGQNLYDANDMEKWSENGSGTEGYPKIITTSRSEILKTEGYKDWFVASISNVDIKMYNPRDYYKEYRVGGLYTKIQVTVLIPAD